MGVTVSDESVPQVKIRPPVLVDSGSSVPSALRVSVGTVPCGAELPGYGLVEQGRGSCAKKGRFAIVYRDGSASALVRDAVATADDRLQIALGRASTLGSAR